jgi:hypothetical protein
MKRGKKCEAKFRADSAPFAALLIGRNSRSEHASGVGGAVKEKYTNPHDFALR